MREIVRCHVDRVGVIFSILLGLLGSVLLTKAVQTDAPTSFFAWRSVAFRNGGARAQHGGQVDRVCSIACVRIMLLC